MDVINVVTVHWQSPQWIDLQLDYLTRHVEAPFRVFASLNGIEAPEIRRRFHFAADLPGGHGVKLNELARQVAAESEPDDVLLFLDGDAFPVGPLVPWIGETLRDRPLAAVRRSENWGDMRPHPSFCVTTVGFWNEVAGDWRPRPWRSPAGQELTDPGTVLYETLQDADVDWLPMLRTNTRDLHPLWFGVYDHRIYHHGAGFRSRFSYVDRAQLRVDAYKARTAKGPRSLGALSVELRKDPSKLLQLRPRHVPDIGRAALKSARRLSTRRYERRADLVAETVFARLADPAFFRELDDAVGECR